MTQQVRTLAPRACPGCHRDHPPLTTCAGGWKPWDGKPVRVAVVTRTPKR